jgi:hypothetical protein
VAANEHDLDVWELAGGGQRLKLRLPGEASAIAFSPDGASLAVAGSSGPVLLWDLRDLHRPRPPKPDAAAQAKLLEWLADKDAPTAYEAMRIVAAWPEETLPLLAKAIPAVAPPDADKLKTCLGKLDAPRYADRDKATRDLMELGELAAPAVRAVLAETGSEEVRQRAESILDRAGASSLADLKLARAVEAAEWAATPQAKQVLGTWAAGAAGARLTQEAKAALRRME